VATATGRQPVVAGKPYEPMAAAVATLLGADHGQLLMVGDRASTDGAFAVTLGCPFALVRTGVTLPGDEVGVPVASMRPISRASWTPSRRTARASGRGSRVAPSLVG
jgi:ribonucleotide monophosphatase NagD (HAD superfamily)